MKWPSRSSILNKHNAPQDSLTCEDNDLNYIDWLGIENFKDARNGGGHGCACDGEGHVLSDADTLSPGRLDQVSGKGSKVRAGYHISVSRVLCRSLYFLTICVSRDCQRGCISWWGMRSILMHCSMPWGRTLSGFDRKDALIASHSTNWWKGIVRSLWFRSLGFRYMEILP